MKLKAKYEILTASHDGTDYYRNTVEELFDLSLGKFRTKNHVEFTIKEIGSDYVVIRLQGSSEDKRLVLNDWHEAVHYRESGIGQYETDEYTRFSLTGDQLPKPSIFRRIKNLFK